MIKLQTTDNKVVGIAIGKENNHWYVQTTDIYNTYLSEAIQNDLVSKEDALAIANQYIEKYGFKLFDWS